MSYPLNDESVEPKDDTTKNRSNQTNDEWQIHEEEPRRGSHLRCWQAPRDQRFLLP